MNLKMIADQALADAMGDSAFSDALDSIDGIALDAGGGKKSFFKQNIQAGTSSLLKAQGELKSGDAKLAGDIASKVAEHKEKCKATKRRCPYEAKMASEAEKMGISPSAVGLAEYDKNAEKGDAETGAAQQEQNPTEPAQVSPNFSAMENAREALKQAESQKEKDPKAYGQAVSAYNQAREAYLNDALGSKEMAAIKKLCEPSVIQKGMDKLKAFVARVGEFLKKDKNSVSRAQATATSMIASAAGIETPEPVLEALGEEPQPADGATEQAAPETDQKNATEEPVTETNNEKQTNPTRKPDVQQHIDRARQETGDETWNACLNFMGSAPNGMIFKIADDVTHERKPIAGKGDDGRYYLLNQHGQMEGESYDLEEIAAIIHDKDVEFNEENAEKRKDEEVEKATGPSAQIDRIMSDYKKEESEILERHKDDQDGTERTRELTEAQKKRDKEIQKHDPIEKGEDGKSESAEEHAKHCKANPKSNCPFLKQHMSKEQLAELDKQSEKAKENATEQRDSGNAQESGSEEKGSDNGNGQVTQEKMNAEGASGSGTEGGPGTSEEQNSDGNRQPDASGEQPQNGTSGNGENPEENKANPQAGGYSDTNREEEKSGGQEEGVTPVGKDDKRKYQNLSNIEIPKSVDDMTKEELTEKRKSVKDELRQMKRNGASDGDIASKIKEYKDLGERIANYKEKVTNETLERDMDNAEKALEEARSKLEEVKNKEGVTQEEIDAAQKAVDDAEEEFNDAEEAWVDGPNAPKNDKSSEEGEHENQEEPQKMSMKELNAAFSAAGITDADIKAIQNLSSYPPEFIAKNIGAFRDILDKAQRFNELKSTEPKFDAYLKALKESGFNTALNFGAIEALEQKAKQSDNLDDRLVIEAARDALMAGKDTQKVIDQMHKTLNANKKERKKEEQDKKADERKDKESINKQHRDNAAKGIVTPDMPAEFRQEALVNAENNRTKAVSKAITNGDDTNPLLTAKEKDLARANAKLKQDKSRENLRKAVKDGDIDNEDLQKPENAALLETAKINHAANRSKAVMPQIKAGIVPPDATEAEKELAAQYKEKFENSIESSRLALCKSGKEPKNATPEEKEIASVWKQKMLDTARKIREATQRIEDAHRDKTVAESNPQLIKTIETIQNEWSSSDDPRLQTRADQLNHILDILKKSHNGDEIYKTEHQFKKLLGGDDEESDFDISGSKNKEPNVEGIDHKNGGVLGSDKQSRQRSVSAQDFLDTSSKRSNGVLKNSDAVRDKIAASLIGEGVNISPKDISVTPGLSSTAFSVKLNQNLPPQKAESVARIIAQGLSVTAGEKTDDGEDKDAADVSYDENRDMITVRCQNDSKGKLSMSDVIGGENQKKWEDFIQKNRGRGVFSPGTDAETGEPIYMTMDDLSHLLMSGITGAGKTVSLDAICASMAAAEDPDDLMMLMVDPKGAGAGAWDGLPHLGMPPIKDMKDAAKVFNWLQKEDMNRQKLFSDPRINVQSLEEYNKMGREGKLPKDVPQHLKRIVFRIDELADLMEQQGKNIASAFKELSSKGRSQGINLLCATQRPDSDAFKKMGTIKANLGSRYAMRTGDVQGEMSIGVPGSANLPKKGPFIMKDANGKMRRGDAFMITKDETQKLIAAAKTKYGSGGQSSDNLSGVDEGNNHAPENPLGGGEKENLGSARVDSEQRHDIHQEQASATSSNEHENLQSKPSRFTESVKKNGLAKKGTALETIKTFKPSSDSLSPSGLLLEVGDAMEATEEEFGEKLSKEGTSNVIKSLFEGKYPGNQKVQKVIDEIVDKALGGGYDDQRELDDALARLDKASKQKVSNNPTLAKHGIPDEGSVDERMADFEPSQKNLGIDGTFGEMTDVLNEMKKSGASEEEIKAARTKAMAKLLDGLPQDSSTVKALARRIRTSEQGGMSDASLKTQLSILQKVLRKGESK